MGVDRWAAFRAAYTIGTEVAGGSASLAHKLFYHREQKWLADLLEEDALMERLRGAMLVFTPSAGEVNAVRPVIDTFSARRPEVPILVCTITSSGVTIARRAGFDCIRLTVGSRRQISRLVRRLLPRGLMIAQVAHTAGLPIGLISMLARQHLPVVLVNGLVTDDDFRTSSRPIWRAVANSFQQITGFGMQSALGAERVISLGANPDTVRVIGDTRYDAAIHGASTEESSALSAALGLSSDPILVAGSTHPGEEEILLEAFRAVKADYPTARLVLAPRSVARCPGLVKLAQSMGFATVARSKLPGDGEVVVLDTMGELRSFYGLAAVTFVGGTLAPVGGHSVLEPAAYGKPVLFGPHTKHTGGAAEILIEEGGAFRISDTADLIKTLASLLGDPALRDRVGASAARAVHSRAGACHAYVELLEELILGAPSAKEGAR